MPEWLHKQLELGAKVTKFNQLTPDGRMYSVETVANETRGILPVLAQLCEQDSHVSRGFICHPDVQHVVKMAREGGFCGYRNIQMMVSTRQEAGCWKKRLRGAKCRADLVHPGRKISGSSVLSWPGTFNTPAPGVDRRRLG